MTDFLLIAFIFLIAGITVVPIASKLGLGSVLGYLIAGIAISPVLILLHVDLVSIQHFAEFGVVMMLFLVGLELEPKLLWEMRHKLIGLGGMQVTGSTFIVMLIALLFGQPLTISIAIGLVFSLSSTAIVLQTLHEKGLMKSDGGQGSFSILLFQDIAVIPMLALIPLLAIPELMNSDISAEASHATMSLVENVDGWKKALITLAAVGFVLLFGTHLTRPLFRFISSAKLRELFTATALMMVIGIALLMSLVGLSPALGTFLAGVVLANSEYRHELESDIAPFKGLLLGLFFMTVGASINFELLFDKFGLIITLTLGLMIIKGLVLAISGAIFKIKGSDRWLMALGLAQAGEFGFVLLSFSVANSVIPTSIADQLMLVVALSMLLTPVLFILFDKVLVPLFSRPTAEADEITEQCDIIVIGHGRVGGVVNRMLRSAGYKTTVIDFSSQQLEMLRKLGLKVFFGDGSRPDLLHSAGIDNAKLLVVAIDDKEQITNLTEYVVVNYPKVHVMARAIDRFHVYDLWSVGCRDIIRETYDSSIRMGRSAFSALGNSMEQSVEMAASFESRDRKAMVETAGLHKRGVPFAENQEYINKVKETLDEWESELIGQSSPTLEPATCMDTESKK